MMKKLILIFFVVLGVTAIIFNVFYYYQQSFVCDKAKNACYSALFGVRISDAIPINELGEITIVNQNRQGNASRQRGRIMTYMPTFLTKQGKSYPFYKSPTTRAENAVQDKYDFLYFLKTGGNNLELKNKDNHVKFY